MSMFRFVYLAFVTLAVAKVVQRGQHEGRIVNAIGAGESLTRDRIAPTFEGTSQHFFKKDYPDDKQPRINVLHFKHPYPAMQDSEDFDHDYVKDQNHDNGAWLAQEEYDRLRHKLTKLKKDVAEAAEAKSSLRKELDEAMKEYQQDMAEDKAAIAKNNKQLDEIGESMKARAEAAVVSEKAKKAWGQQVPQKPKIAPPPTVGPFQFEDPVPKALRNLEECQRQLEEANAELKKRMDELEKAKVQQVEAQEKLNEAQKKENKAVKAEDQMHKSYTKEKQEHAAAEAAYLKQKELVEKLRAEFDAAAAAVRRMRAAEDKSGGVYPTPRKSAARSGSLPLLFALVCAVAFCGQIA